MRLTVLTAGAALLLCPAAALAQTTTPPTNAPASSQADAATTAAHTTLRAHMRDMLQKAGFSDIRMMPSSFMIHAKDQDGNPVVMSVRPDSITEIAEVGSAGSAGSTASNGSDNAAMSSSGGSAFVSVNHNDNLSSNVVGLDVYNTSNQDIGQIKDIAMGPGGRTQAYILSVGGFLGVGDHYIAVNPSDIKVSYNTSEKKWHAAMNTNADQLKAAPEFKYNGRWDASKS